MKNLLEIMTLDVTILVNGLPLVHVELKRRSVAINQINRYQRDSFLADCGLYEYVQIFVISNGTFTKHYSNTTRVNHVKENDGNGRKRSKKTSNSFEVTSYWADGNNKIIADSVDFTKAFFAKRTILNILIKYCLLWDLIRLWQLSVFWTGLRYPPTIKTLALSRMENISGTPQEAVRP